MIRKIRKIIKPKYETLNKMEIRRVSIVENFNILQAKQPEAKIFPVLKSNAYGHGLAEICSVLNDTEAEMVAIDSFPEAQIAYRYFKKRVLILGEMPSSVYRYCKLTRTDFCVYNQESLLSLAKLGRARIHLFFNSGMNREGIQDLEKFLNDNKQVLKKMKVVGFCSHLASSDEESALNQKQLANFLKGLDILEYNGYYPEYVHLGNSAAIFTMHEKRLTAFRSGLALYGYNPLDLNHRLYNEASKLKPALRLISTVVSIQDLKKGDTVSYNEAYVAEEDTRIAVIPFGYYEGLSRNFSNQAEFSCDKNDQKHLLKVAGKVCMNLCCLNIFDYNIKIGDKVEIVSWNQEDKNSVLNLSKIAQQIPYEFLVKIQVNIRREIV